MIKDNVIGSEVLHFGSVTSTNDYLKEHSYLPSGTVVSTDYQTKGRGTKSNSWESARFQNLLMSVILKPDMLVSEVGQIVKLTSVAVYSTLSQFGLDSQIKWPNDVMVKHKKIAGILVESSITKNSIDYIVIGVGLNVNQTYFRQLSEIATSMKKEGIEVQGEDVKGIFIQFLNKYYQQFNKGSKEYLELYKRVKYENE